MLWHWHLLTSRNPHYNVQQTVAFFLLLLLFFLFLLLIWDNEKHGFHLQVEVVSSSSKSSSLSWKVESTNLSLSRRTSTHPDHNPKNGVIWEYGFQFNAWLAGKKICMNFLWPTSKAKIWMRMACQTHPCIHAIKAPRIKETSTGDINLILPKPNPSPFVLNIIVFWSYGTLVRSLKPSSN